MRKLYYLGFCLVLAMGVGCAITDYGVITDNDQAGPGQAQPGGFIVNTNGKAHIIETTGVSWLYGDGHHEEGFTFADQNSSGDQTLTAYINFSLPGDATFHDDTYCNPDWNGCAFWTADNPATGDASPLDGTHNLACFQGRAGWGLKVTTARLSECGRFAFGDLSMTDSIAMALMGSPTDLGGLDALLYAMTPNTLTAVIGGQNVQLPALNVYWLPNNGRMYVDGGHPLLGQRMRQVDSIVGNSAFTIDVWYNGLHVISSDGQAKFGGIGSLTNLARN